MINVPGATGNTGMTKLLSGQSDGYSMAILIGDTAATLVSGGARWKLADVTPLAIAIRQPSGLFVKADSRFKTWNDVVAEAKAKPGTLKVAILGFGSADDITLNFLAGKGIKMIGVPFASPGERYSSILGGHADLHRYSDAGEKTLIRVGEYNPEEDTCYEWPSRSAGGVVDQDYAKVFIDDRASGRLIWRGAVTAETRSGSTEQGVRQLTQMAREIAREVPARAGAQK